MTQTIKKLWEELLDKVNQSPDFETLTSQSSENISFMKKMGFADIFIEIAKNQRGFVCGDLQIDWMYSWLQRQNRFFELRPKMLPIGDDGCGNYIYIYDVSNPNSQIIYMSHDPAVLMVIASSMEDFLQKILSLLKRSPNEKEPFSTFMETYELSNAAMKVWKYKAYNGKENNLGFDYQEVSDDQVHANFTEAQPKSGISLAFFGKYSEVYYTNIKDVIVVEKMEVDGVKKLKEKDKKSWFYLALLLPLSYGLLGLIEFAPAIRVAIIMGTLLFLPWVFDFIRFIRKSSPRL